MKKFYSFFLAALLLLASCAKDPEIPTPETPAPGSHRVSVEAALSELTSMMDDLEGGETRSSVRRSVGSIATVRAADVLPATRSDDVPDVEDLVYIANFEGGAGYAILAADDRLVPVLAIVDSGSLTEEEFAAVARGEYSDEQIPPVYPDVVDYALRIGTGGLGTGGGTGGGGGYIPPTGDIITGDGYPAQGRYTTYGPWQVYRKVNPLVITKWGQDLPYNYYTIHYNSGILLGKPLPLSKAGCVAVALGQLIVANYYNKGQISYSKLSIGGRAINWSVLCSEIDRYIANPSLIRYYENKGYPSAALDVATLLRGIGSEVEMNYGSNESGTTDEKAEKFLRNVMGYKNVDLFSSDLITKIEMILKAGCPVYVYGSRTGGAHAWLVDGMLRRERSVNTCLGGVVISSYMESYMLYHCNFGWTGTCDGYYYSNGIFNPSKAPVIREDGGDDRPGSSTYNYDGQHRIIFYTL